MLDSFAIKKNARFFFKFSTVLMTDALYSILTNNLTYIVPEFVVLCEKVNLNLTHVPDLTTERVLKERRLLIAEHKPRDDIERVLLEVSESRPQS